MRATGENRGIVKVEGVMYDHSRNWTGFGSSSGGFKPARVEAIMEAGSKSFSERYALLELQFEGITEDWRSDCVISGLGMDRNEQRLRTSSSKPDDSYPVTFIIITIDHQHHTILFSATPASFDSRPTSTSFNTHSTQPFKAFAYQTPPLTTHHHTSTMLTFVGFPHMFHTAYPPHDVIHPLPPPSTAPTPSTAPPSLLSPYYSSSNNEDEDGDQDRDGEGEEEEEEEEYFRRLAAVLPPGPPFRPTSSQHARARVTWAKWMLKRGLRTLGYALADGLVWVGGLLWVGLRAV
ncbi:hypothetical protein EJ05DRAFT_499097 [Pseudovirgaria hyperparasitica]|uniref:Uncharacterized protein n=1 Tax=Pseudovirgaria hyperparasitica TaxID=470096 RepID=A0A6A6WCX2_9PEZI|nr:uncharacterized protein EJ05DRAFT_499097 [Pseudovirgaria hyperparasitica]KAF2759904.1 hypothetical protein EJ05DRAFT_499097 [Pseudovirgaria hyperparasitica]